MRKSITRHERCLHGKEYTFLDTNIENGGFRGLLVIEKMVLCIRMCCNIAKLKKHMGKVTYAPVIG